MKYLCDSHLGDNKDSLNEYRIGVEALGRPADFDPAKNSSVRVEVHRLRARLRKYYETEGAHHPLRIVLAEGHYRLQFVSRDDSLPAFSSQPRGFGNPAGEQVNAFAGTDPAAGTVQEAGNPLAIPSRSRIPYLSPGLLAIASAVVLLAIALAWTWAGAPWRVRSAHQPVATPPSLSDASLAGADGSGAVLILAGYPKEKYIDREGRVWGGDRYFTGGEATEQNFSFIQGTADLTMFRTARTGEFSYDIPVKPGLYELRLYFAETVFGPGTLAGKGESSRVFNVLLNGQLFLSSFDVLSQAGGNDQAFTRVFRDVSPAADGKVHLDFRPDADRPFVNAIALLPETGGRISPVRITMQENSYVDHAGRLWEADQYFRGGILSAPQDFPVGAGSSADPHLFDRQRYGNFTYQIPVAPGRYTVALYLAETYFGTGAGRTADPSPRIFDVYANGEALLRNFDILKEAGGPNRPLIKTFRGIHPNAAGQIDLSFVPVKNYACVEAIEVTDESP